MSDLIGIGAAAHPDIFGIPDEPETKSIDGGKPPSWKRICWSVLANDYWGKRIGFSQTKSGNVDRYLEMMERRRERWNVDVNEIDGSLCVR